MPPPAKEVFIKIDAEGFEFPVIRGGKTLLDKSPSVAILFEFSFAWKESGESIEQCFQFLNSLGYDFYRLTPYGLEHLRFITQDMNHIQYCNYVALKGVDLSAFSAMNIPSPYGENLLVRFP